MNNFNYSNAGPLAVFRYSLIKLLAGKAVVILNAHIQVVPVRPHHVTVDGAKHGFLCVNTEFSVADRGVEINLRNGESIEA